MSKYSDEFKLEVVRTYLEGHNGIRVTARAFGLPSKNYIENWMNQLKKKGLLPEDIAKPCTNLSERQVLVKSQREIELEKENIRLKAEVEYLKKLEELERRSASKK